MRWQTVVGLTATTNQLIPELAVKHPRRDCWFQVEAMAGVMAHKQWTICIPISHSMVVSRKTMDRIFHQMKNSNGKYYTREMENYKE